MELYEKYRIESEIGRGASGVCYRVQNIKTKELFAMKKIHITSIKVFVALSRSIVPRRLALRSLFLVKSIIPTS